MSEGKERRNGKADDDRLGEGKERWHGGEDEDRWAKRGRGGEEERMKEG